MNESAMATRFALLTEEGRKAVLDYMDYLLYRERARAAIPILSDAVSCDMDVILTGDRDFLEAGLSRPKALSVSMLADFLGIA